MQTSLAIKILYLKPKTLVYKMNDNKIIWGPGSFCMNPTHLPLHCLRHLYRPLKAENCLKATCSRALDLCSEQARTRTNVYTDLHRPGPLGYVQCDTYSSPNRRVQETALWKLRLHLLMGCLKALSSGAPKWRPTGETSFAAKWHEMLCAFSEELVCFLFLINKN